MHALKRQLYFVVAGYFAFWAKFVLRRWQPRIIVITGSSGKTTTLHLVEAQIGAKAVYSHHANSSYGIPFNILGLPTNVESKAGWLLFLLRAPFGIIRKLPAQKLYIVEADTDRPHEGEFIARLLRPEVTLWVSVFRTHGMNFDRQVQAGQFTSPDEAIAYDFGNYATNTQKLVLANGDQPLLVHELTRVPDEVDVKRFSLKGVTSYRPTAEGTEFKIAKKTIKLPGLHPKQIGVSLQMVDALLDYLKIPERSYEKLVMPPGRTSVFKGKKDITIVDSTYNTGLGAMTAIIELFEKLPGAKKWLILGDILEQGSVEQEEHEQLAHVIASTDAKQVILLGPRTRKYTLPVLHNLKPRLPTETFDSPKEVSDFLQANLHGGETILFKGARGLEGAIELLLADPDDADKLVRREPHWVKYRQSWGFQK